jgi:hypothetical protein
VAFRQAVEAGVDEGGNNAVTRAAVLATTGGNNSSPVATGQSRHRSLPEPTTTRRGAHLAWNTRGERALPAITRS